MAIIKKYFLGNVIGKFEGVIFCERRGTNYIRKEAKPSEKKPTEKMLIHRSKFAGAVSMYKATKDMTIRTAWKTAAIGMKPTGYNLFVSYNQEIFDGKGSIVDHAMIKMSKGCLNLPLELKCRTISSNEFEIEWNVSSDVYSGKENDELFVVLMYDDDTFRLVSYENLNVKRKDGGVLLVLPDGEEQPEHLYCFFGSSDRQKFSDSHYMRLDWGKV